MAKANKRKQAQAARGAAINDDFRQMIAERLLEGAEPDDLAKRVSGSAGLPLALVEQEIARAAKSPYLQAAEKLRNRIGKWEWVLQNNARLAANDPHGLEIPVIGKVDGETFYRDYYRAHRPVVIQGQFDHWEARERWSLDYFRRVLGNREVFVQTGRESDENYEINTRDHGAMRPFGELYERLASEEPTNDFYITANNSAQNRETFRAFYTDIGELPGILAPGGQRDGFIWVGPKGTITPWHHDLTNNLLIQMVGRKKVYLVASHDTPKMRNHFHCYSRWQHDELLPGPATKERPAVLECTLGPGDGLFIPIGWWHCVLGLDQTIGMSFTQFAWDNDFYSDYKSYVAF
ncbi:cupin-like domain-containing protein [Stakelama tenebrarum]|uniref:Cupin-like domain-containing protein n=1 Tax=Stakelama tenebrarum TaxID=2711215 RepID=A0A6G6Y6R1_9SPHN|nr:cupin-like domain-containing protein [Sphingosinithalassobacter tenebrarum]QIG80622.1 cupin-like domain-containing protein [Sphingosinithalassobacter tenebrarum]